MKRIVNIFSRFMISLFVIVLFNKMAMGVNMYIPINIITVILVVVFEIPGLIMLIIFDLLLV